MKQFSLFVVMLSLVRGSSHCESLPDLQKRAMEDIAQIEMQLLLYRVDNGFYPTTVQGLIALIEKPIIAPLPVGWKKHGKKVPSLDPWGRPYVYKGIIAPGKQYAQAYEVYSLGEDLGDSTDDVLVTGP